MIAREQRFSVHADRRACEIGVHLEVHIGADGLHRHDMYLAQVKSPAESKYPWDYYKIVKTIPAPEAFQPPDPICPQVKK